MITKENAIDKRYSNCVQIGLQVNPTKGTDIMCNVTNALYFRLEKDHQFDITLIYYC